jgi:aspartokinase
LKRDPRLEGPVIVRKYGGSSLADIPRLQEIARSLKVAVNQGHHLVVVVSAMGNQTDELVRLACEANPEPPRRELDMLLTVGERISMSLLCMALAREGVPAISLTGSQVGIITDASHTDARITEVKAFRIREALTQGNLVVVAGFQGFSAETRDITTLGRGGSDTTAVALAHALNAERCEILKDVPGVMTADPKLLPDARLIQELSFEQMQLIADAGCGVVHPRAVAHAARYGVPIFVGSSFTNGTGTVIGTVNGHEHTPHRDGTTAFAWQPLVVTVTSHQASLCMWSCTANPSAMLFELAERASTLCSLTAEWLDRGDDFWRWEGWGAEAAMDSIAASADKIIAQGQAPFRYSWQPGQAILSLAGRRPESWSGSLHRLRQMIQAVSGPAVRLRTDGQAVRLMGPEDKLRDLLPELHEMVAIT